MARTHPRRPSVRKFFNCYTVVAAGVIGILVIINFAFSSRLMFRSDINFEDMIEYYRTWTMYRKEWKAIGYNLDRAKAITVVTRTLLSITGLCLSTILYFAAVFYAQKEKAHKANPCRKICYALSCTLLIIPCLICAINLLIDCEKLTKYDYLPKGKYGKPFKSLAEALYLLRPIFVLDFIQVGLVLPSIVYLWAHVFGLISLDAEGESSYEAANPFKDQDEEEGWALEDVTYESEVAVPKPVIVNQGSRPSAFQLNEQ